MGVIYKLTEEVIQFLLQRKKDFPAMSCRQLATLASQKFQAKISKSSINNILKRESLSSPVGRRVSFESKEKKFQIPTGKKNEILTNLEKSGLPIVPSAMPSLRQKIVTAQKEIHPSPEAGAIKSSVSKDKVSVDVDAPLADYAEFSHFVAQTRQKRIDSQKQSFETAELLFVKWAEWEISSSSVLSQVIKGPFENYLKEKGIGQFLTQQEYANLLDQYCGVYLSLVLLGKDVDYLEKIKHNYSNGLFILNRPLTMPITEEPLSLDLRLWPVFCQWLKESPQLSAAEYSLLKQQAFCGIRNFKIFLENGTQLFMDASLSSLWAEEEIDFLDSFSIPSPKAMSFLSHFLISNNEPIILFAMPGQTALSKSFYNLISFFENKKGCRATQIELFDRTGDLISSFPFILEQKRIFMLGLRPWQKEFTEFLKAAKWAGKRPFYHEGLDKAFYFSQTRKDLVDPQGGNVLLSVISLWEEESSLDFNQPGDKGKMIKEKEPVCMILTNDRDSSSEKILRDFLWRWPNLTDGPACCFFQGKRQKEIQRFSDHSLSVQEGSVSEQGLSPAAVFSDFGRRLLSCCFEYLDSAGLEKGKIASLIPEGYKFSASLWPVEGHVIAQISLPEGFPEKEIVKAAASAINERFVAALRSQRIFLKVQE